ncbi:MULTISPECIES: hypothetical protein [Dyella]|uniref:Uncharacterized protein n=2 Tax=Dyella TaxID=231454 RepID=A0A4R0YJP7_9GAMM|nr:MULTISPECIES: hypothetical protein [Dyella]TBR36101.1 hypothetical protein EYV96_15975 [Dyella terrae]TCI06150.1 hypothetical protein EZM97_35065 [Dyella soli]
MEAQSLVALPVVLALELPEGARLNRLTLERDQAAELASLIAADLHALVPAVNQARLAVAGALFDAVELLRPGFPVWATLDELARRVPRGHLDNVVAFGTHDGHMPAQPLEPAPMYADGPMRLLPLTLLAPEDLAAELLEQLEVELVGRGEAGERTADWLIRQLGLPLEHVRYLTRNDLIALTCVQYEHVNLAALWQVLEAGLLTPYKDEHTLTARGLALQYHDGKVLAQSPSAWLAAQTDDIAQRPHDLAGILFELRQYAALLDAHHLPLSLQPTPGTAAAAGDGYLVEVLGAVDPAYDPPSLFAHEAPGLGVVAITLAQRGDGGRARVLAHGYPLHSKALGPLVSHLAGHVGIPAEVHALGRILLDDEGQLGAPAQALH